MANTNIPFGFRPNRYLNGSPWNGKFRIYYIGSTSAGATPILAGDPVSMMTGGTTWTATTYTDPLGMYPSVIVAPQAAATLLVGVAVAFGTDPSNMYIPADLYTNWRAASTARYVGVVDDPNVIFQVQDDGVAVITPGLIGLNAEHNTISNATVGGGQSTATLGTTLGSTGIALTATLMWRILGLSQTLAVTGRENNFGQAYAVWDVLMNCNIFKTGTAGHAIS